MKTFEARQFINHDSDFSTILRHLPPIDSDGPWVAGGSVWKAIENRPLEHDIDFFFKSAEQCERWYRELLSMPYVHRIVSIPKANDYNTTLKYHVHFRGFNKTVKLQFITFSFYKDIETLFSSFDFTACQFALDGQTIYTGDTSLDDVRNREIVFNNVRDNQSTLVHLERYIKLGFNAAANSRQKFDEILALRKPVKKDSLPSPTGIFASYGSPRPALRDDMDNGDDDAYPRRHADSTTNQGINLVRATQIPRRPARQEQPRSIWDMPSSNPASYVSEPIAIDNTYITNNTTYANTTVNMSYYTSVDMGAESPAAPTPPLAAEAPMTYDNGAVATPI